MFVGHAEADSKRHLKYLRPRLWDVEVAGTEAASARCRKPKGAPRLLIGQEPGQGRSRNVYVAVCCDNQSEPGLGLALALSQGSLENQGATKARERSSEGLNLLFVNG